MSQPTALTIDVLDAPVSIYRDDWSIAHAQAQTVTDAFVAQGYLHAADRMWHMDSARKQMEGRWAEWVGPAGVELDKLNRRVGAAQASRRDYAALGNEARQMCDAYAAGVNAWIAQTERPLEYQLLETEIEPWEGWHCVAAMRQRGFLIGSLAFKLWRAACVGVLAPEQIAKLRWDDGGTDRLLLPPGTDAQRWIASLAELAPAIDAVREVLPKDATGGGSNNWAVSGTRTASGKPLMAGDPHRLFDMPSMYHQMHLACAEFDVIGLTIPGVPGFPHFAHSANVAWGVTIAFTDQHDVFVERFDADGRYLYRDEWYDAERSTEAIVVRGGDDVDVDIVRTRHGAVVAGETTDASALALLSIQFDREDHSVDCLLPMLRAGDVDSFYDSTRGWGIIDHNLVAADTSGNIGHLVRALVPRRPAINGWLPVPGWGGDYDWDGVIAFEDMPRVTNPERGYIATANNRVTDRIPSTGDYFCTDAHPPYRCRRIEELLDPLSEATIADMSAIHRDSFSSAARAVVDRILGVPDLDDTVRSLLSDWDARLEPDSAAAAAYSQLRWRLARIVTDLSGMSAAASGEINAVPPGTGPVDKMWFMLPGLLRTDDESFLGGRTWDGVIAEAAAGVATNKTWSEEHVTLLVHPLAAMFPDAGLSPAGIGVGGDNETVWANSCAAPVAPRASSGSVARYAFDLADWERSGWVVLSGVSGDPRSEHYRDQHEPWSRCQLVPMPYSWSEITERFPLAETLDPTEASDG
ncbi:penicillin acylase family protein [Epidermidibacterium keratini]|uniref:Penicillin acylase family protein n=1 Tax=Epidermidibacterium keratini TaxID=1891644 RepID=A0A7L4YL58_9ACTN|nr:penicillin acylase family protein [Epidermidibacterium keratini]QHB99568.1 penicillin acylase family protein [Epidermidibacterium keratini]